MTTTPLHRKRPFIILSLPVASPKPPLSFRPCPTVISTTLPAVISTTPRRHFDRSGEISLLARLEISPFRAARSSRDDGVAPRRHFDRSGEISLLARLKFSPFRTSRDDFFLIKIPVRLDFLSPGHFPGRLQLLPGESFHKAPVRSQGDHMKPLVQIALCVFQ